ncbi:hypothetical protein U9M48_007667 [Paspalum notatum var. saurae]|uniref:DEK-C domain-containing protein n=1 Tax=Paspalum notatum var. saurae TaxID=547442 RepID=A0AAQ3SMS0_PASNO
MTSVAPETKLIKQPTWVFVEKESVTDLREQILQLIEHDCQEQEEKLQGELLEKLNRCKRDTLIELCRSFHVIGSRANRKEELVSFLMEFVKDHCSGIDGTNSDKKIKKRRRVKEENLSTGKPSKKKKQEGGQEVDGNKGVEDRAKYSDYDLMDSRYVCADSKKGKFPNEPPDFEPSERINGSMSANLDGVSRSEVPITTDELAMITTPPMKLVTTAEGDSTDMKALKNKNSSITKKKATPKEDLKIKMCGKRESKGDTKPQKQAMKPSKDELREAVFLILDTADFATMTFGDVVKEVDKYFGKDLFERKPLVRSLIEEELFRLTEEAEKKELEEEEAAGAKARAEQAAEEMVQVQTVESGINKQNILQADQNGNTKDSSKNLNSSTNEKGVDIGASVESAVKRNSSDAAEGSEGQKADADTNNKNICDELTKDSKGEKLAPIADSDNVIQGSSHGEAETMKNDNVETLEGYKDSKMEGAGNGENDDTEDCRNEGIRSGNVGNNAEAANGCEAEGSNDHGNSECVEHTEDGKAQEAINNEKFENSFKADEANINENSGKPQEANNNEKSANVEIHGDKDSTAKEGDINVEQSQADGGGNGKAEDAEHSARSKVAACSNKNGGGAENGSTDGDAKGNSDGAAEGSPT